MLRTSKISDFIHVVLVDHVQADCSCGHMLDVTSVDQRVYVGSSKLFLEVADDNVEAVFFIFPISSSIPSHHSWSETLKTSPALKGYGSPPLCAAIMSADTSPPHGEFFANTTFASPSASP